MPIEHTPEQEAFRASWKARAIVATGGRTTEFGTILLAILGASRGLPSYAPAAVIDKNGLIYGEWLQMRDGELVGPVAIGPVAEFTGWLNRLADTIKASDQERMELFAEVRKWIKVDERALIALDETPLGAGATH